MFTPLISSNSTVSINQISRYVQNYETIQSSDSYIWPLPGHTYLSSYFGKRNSPTAYATSYHKGIDIPAPEGTYIFAVASGTVTMAKFNGSGGCTVIITNENLSFTYCHVSPTFIVSVGQKVEKGNLIAYVGPKNLYGFSENIYYDSEGKPTNGATTGSHLHLTISENGIPVDPLKYVHT